MRQISPNRLIDGGAAMLEIDRRSHHIEIAGNRDRIPLVKNILRELVASYDILARANIHDEHRP